jgi:anti-sigma B factor antagonist
VRGRPPEAEENSLGELLAGRPGIFRGFWQNGYNIRAAPGHSPEGEPSVENLRLQTHVRNDPPFPVLVVTGEIDVFTAPLFKQAVVNLVAAGHRHLFLDLSGVTFMDSSGFGALLGATKRLRPDGGTLNLIGCNRTIKRMLHLTRLDTILGLYETKEEAGAAAK